MSTVIQNRFDGGHAEDVRTPSLDQCEKSNNFDIFREPHRLNPLPDTVAETVTGLSMDDVEISDVDICAISGTDYIVAAGYESGVSAALTFYTKTSQTAAFGLLASATGNSYQKGSLITYKARAYAVDYNGSTTFRLIGLNGASSVSTIGSISYTPVGTVPPVVCLIHPEDNCLYVFIGNTISKWDGTTFTSSATILPANHTASSAAPYAGYVAIVVNPMSGNRSPVCLLWGRDITLNTLQGTIDLGEGYCPIVENLDNNLAFILSPYASSSPSFVPANNKITVKMYAGGTVDTIKEISVTGSGQVLALKAKKDNKLYFARGNSDSIWMFGKNKSGIYTLTQDLFVINGVQISSSPSSQNIIGLSIIGDIFWIGTTNQSGVTTLQRTTTTYASTSIYKTVINPGMAVGDRYKDKQLEAVQIAYTGVANGTVALKYSVDGSAMTSVISDSTTATEDVSEATGQADNSSFLTGREFQFQIESTGGVKIKEIRFRYSILNATV